MIQKMGERIHGWIAGLIVVAISITFALWGLSSFIGGGNLSTTVIAKVNGQKLTQQTLNELFQNLTKVYPALASASLTKRKQTKKQLIDQWVHQTSVQTTLSNAGMMVGPAVVRNMVLSNPQFQQKGHFSSYLFQAFLMQNQLTQKDFYDRESKSWASQQFTQALQNSALVTPQEIARYYQLLTQKRSFRYHVIQSKDYLNQVHVGEHALQSYYQNHQADFKVPEKVSIDYIALTPKLVRSEVHITDKAMRTYYHNQIQHYSKGKKVTPFIQAKASIYAILSKKQIAQLLSQKSDELTNLTLSHPNSLTEVAKMAGIPLLHTKPFTRKGATKGSAVYPKIVAAAFSDIVLTQDMTSDPITLANGSVVYIHLNKHMPAHVRPFSAVKQKVKKLFMKNAALQLAVKHAHTIADTMNQSKPVSVLWTSYQKVGMDNKHIPSNIKTAVFNTPFAPKQTPVAIVVPMGDDQVAVAQVQQVIVNPTTKTSAKEMANLRTSMLGQRSKALAKLMNNSLYQHSKIKVYLNKISNAQQ